jgi:hypothetical protein
MDNSSFKHQHSILLYLVFEGFKCGHVNQQEKFIMKQLIMQRNPKVYSLLKEYQRDGKPENFWNNFKDFIYHNELELIECDSYYNNGNKNSVGEYEKSNSKNGISFDDTTVDYMSSPSDSFLLKQKKQKNHIRAEKNECREKLEQSAKENHSMNIITNHNPETLIKECEEGISPKISRK